MCVLKGENFKMKMKEKHVLAFAINMSTNNLLWYRKIENAMTTKSFKLLLLLPRVYNPAFASNLTEFFRLRGVANRCIGSSFELS